MKKRWNGWETKWKEILENPDGSINIKQLKKELHDFDDLIDRMIELTCYLTKDRLSYPTYPVSTIIQVMQDIQEEDLEQQLEDDIADLQCSFCNSDLGMINEN